MRAELVEVKSWCKNHSDAERDEEKMRAEVVQVKKSVIEPFRC